MLRSGLTAAHYVSPEIFAAEQQRLFRELWIFAGYANLVARPNEFLTRRIGGIPVVVQNLENRLRAFENVCAHRQMALQTDDYGARALICRYHGWAYDANGRVKGIPNAGLYQFDDAERGKLCLREFAVRVAGNLVFVNLSADPLAFEDQFHPEFIDSMSEASSYFDAEVIQAEFPAGWNWKLNFENVLDYNHIQFIHSTTFFPLLNESGQPEEASLSPKMDPILAQVRRGDGVDLRDLSYAVHSPAALRKPWYRHLVSRFGELDDYYNWFIFPNVNFCSVHGQMFLLQQFMPAAPARTEFNLSVTTARRKDPDSEFTALLSELIRREKLVIDEDAVALEALQAGLHANAPRASHGDYEAHIVRMLRWYAARMSGS